MPTDYLKSVLVRVPNTPNLTDKLLNKATDGFPNFERTTEKFAKCTVKSKLIYLRCFFHTKQCLTIRA